jgi:hypothetical protein
MKTWQSGVLAAICGATILIAGCASNGGSTGGSGGPSASTRADPASPQRPASGTADDTLQACLARIPSGASAGQRMIAEESCKRDDAARKAIEVVPGR